jgi:hypothetical protein
MGWAIIWVIFSQTYLVTLDAINFVDMIFNVTAFQRHIFTLDSNRRPPVSMRTSWYKSPTEL